MLRTSGVSPHLALGLLVAVVAMPAASHAAGNQPELTGRLEAALARPDAGLGLGADVVRALAEVYEERSFQPIWLRPDGRAETLMAAFEQADREGLDPEAYRVARWGAGRDQDSPAALASFELRLSATLLRFAGDLSAGRLDPHRHQPDLFVQPRPALDAAEILRAAAAADELEDHLRRLRPSNAPYRRLQRALSAYRTLAAAGGWPEVSSGPVLKLGQRDPRVPALRARLRASGDLTIVPSGDPETYDAALAEALRGFQRRHGLDADAQLGPRTLAALNVPVGQRLRQIELNMERWRWMPDDLGDRYILVNLAAFELEVVEDGRVSLAMDVVVGKPYRQTPVFAAPMTHLVLNPTWTVPPKIAANDLLPKVQEDPTWLAANGFRVFANWQADAAELESGRIDWRRVGPGRFPYRLVQTPGAKNALGQVKFMLPNAFDVYLHDTSSRELFRQTVRTFSSGCIRLSRPLDLAALLLEGEPKWPRPALDRALAEGKTLTVRLPQPLPVYLTYSTAWIGEGGTVHFRDDVYGRDATLAEALLAPAPS